MDQLARETTIIDERYILKKFEVSKSYFKGTQQIKKTYIQENILNLRKNSPGPSQHDESSKLDRCSQEDGAPSLPSSGERLHYFPGMGRQHFSSPQALCYWD